MAIMMTVFLLLFVSNVWAVDCSQPPTSGWGSEYSAYASWCRSCGGTPYNNNGVGCQRGPNWGQSTSVPAANAPALQMMQLGTQMMVEGLKGIGQETPEQAAAREAARRELEAKRQAKQNQLDNETGVLFALANSSGTRQNTDFRASRTCNSANTGEYMCHVIVCGGAYGGDSVCCPDGFPKLNECDCKCYRSDAEFECQRYAACQYSTVKPMPAENKK